MYNELFNTQENLFRTIASRKRLELIQLLHDRELTVSEMSSMLGIRQANVSQHLSELRKSNIVTTHRTGTTIRYKLSDQRITQICNLAKAFLAEHHAFGPELMSVLNDDHSLFPVAIDPVCGMRISRAHAAESANYKDETFFFCASGCHNTFIAHPSQYYIEKRR